MRVGFVTPRYGTEVIGGAESAARHFAEHLVSELGWQVEAFSTCALDHLTWRNELAPGDSDLNGVTVHRFRSRAGRDRAFHELDGELRVAPRHATMSQAERWVDLNGPVVPDLVDAVSTSALDAVVFYPYLFYPTVRAIGKVNAPAVLHPAAHDEPALYLPVFKETFASAAALCYQTYAERELVQSVHRVAHLPQIVLGLGVDASAPVACPGGELLGVGDRPYVVSVGRVDDHKGSTMLAAYFRAYKERRPGPLALALVGPVSARIPEHPDVVVTGPVGESEKWDILRGALASVSPSALEAFSLVVIESWSAGVPVVVNATCGPTKEHCVRSGGGLWFASYPQFEVILDHLVGDPVLRQVLAERGRSYVDTHFRWPKVIRRYGRFVSEMAGHEQAPAGLSTAPA